MNLSQANGMYLRLRKKVLLTAGDGELPQSVIAALLKNLQRLGYTLSPQVMAVARTLTLEAIKTFHDELIANLRALLGTQRAYRAMYPNFPVQVMEMSEAQLYINAQLHYYTLLLPDGELMPRPALPSFEANAMIVIELGSLEDFEGIFTTLCQAKTSISAQDIQDLRWFVSQLGDDCFRLLPTQFDHKENLAVLSAALLQHASDVRALKFLHHHLKTATDALRLAVAGFDGDVSLAKPTRFGSISRARRRMLLGLLETFHDPIEDMQRWRGRWLRLAERLHSGEWAAKFPKTALAFNVLRNDRENHSFASRIDRKLRHEGLPEALALLKSRPGELARKLDHLLRLELPNKAQSAVTYAFAEVAARVSTPVLLQVITHFKQRALTMAQQQRPLRTFFPKGVIAKAYAMRDTLAPIAAEHSLAIVQHCQFVLRERFAKLPPLGRCYLDNTLSDFLVPFSQRSAAKSLRTLVRGSQLDLPRADTLRFFLWWKNGAMRTDIDLSAAFFDADFQYLDVVAYYNLKSFGGHHSGDVVDAPRGAAEFIDVSKSALGKQGVRYIVMCVNAYTNQPYCDLPECFAGWMARATPNSGEIFEPRTLKDRIDLSADTRISLPVLFDLETNKSTWLDLALKQEPRWNNVHCNLSGISIMARALSDTRRPNLYELFELHIQARGERVFEVDHADTVFALDRGITPFDLSTITAHWIG